MKKPTAIIHGTISPKIIDGKDWESILFIGTRELERQGFNWQLGFGTLLGAIREKDKYIKHEIDLDVDVLIDNTDGIINKIDSLIKNFKSLGFDLVRTQWFPYKEEIPMSIAFLHKKLDIIFDICIFYGIWGEDYLHIGVKGIVIRPKYTKDTKQIIINGNKYNVPHRAKDYLAGRYGEDWMIPKHSKGNWFQDCGKYFIPLNFD